MFSLLLGLVLVIANLIPAVYFGITVWTWIGLLSAGVAIIIGIIEINEDQS